MNSRHFIAAVLFVLAIAALMRGVWLTADPPVRRSVGIVWHDEGAWVHNARNKALWDVWRTDNWNPVFVAPVFTALEYASFSAFGVGTAQARLVPVISGLVTIVCLMIGLRAVGGAAAAFIGGSLLATNYAWVMWNRAALMESTMTMWMAAAWMAWALADRRPAWGAAAGMTAVAAFFTKAAAAFFVVALAADAALMTYRAWRSSAPDRRQQLHQSTGAAIGLAMTSAAIGLLFVVPHWTDYQFYNWQMSVTRKPEYTVGALIDRATWIPIVQGIFSRMWIELLAACACLLAIVLRWHAAKPAARLLVLWLIVGLVELVTHDSGNERRYVMFIPAIVALASLLLAPDSRMLSGLHESVRSARLAAVALLPLVLYLAAGSLLRPLLVDRIEAGELWLAVRLAAGFAAGFVLLLVWRGGRLLSRLATWRMPPRPSFVLVAMAIVWNLVQFADWARARTTYNHDASKSLATLLDDGTIVQGKLANGMALENRIRPLFVGNQFGNYDDRLQRDDARYILTYDLPRIGYESSDGSGLIQGILDHYPRWRIVASFDVDETRMADRAVLIDKFPDDDTPAHARD